MIIERRKLFWEKEGSNEENIKYFVKFLFFYQVFIHTDLTNKSITIFPYNVFVMSYFILMYSIKI